MSPWDVIILAKTKAGAERQLKAEIAKRSPKHIEIMTPLRVWLGLLPELPDHVIRIQCRGYLNGKGAKITAVLEIERLHE